MRPRSATPPLRAAMKCCSSASSTARTPGNPLTGPRPHTSPGSTRTRSHRGRIQPTGAGGPGDHQVCPVEPTGPFVVGDRQRRAVLESVRRRDPRRVFRRGIGTGGEPAVPSVRAAGFGRGRGRDRGGRVVGVGCWAGEREYRVHRACDAEQHVRVAAGRERGIDVAGRAGDRLVGQRREQPGVDVLPGRERCV